MSLRILMATEGSHLRSGYGTYTKEVLSRLHKMGFTVGEFANFTTIDDIKRSSSPWIIYPNAVSKQDPRWSTYKSEHVNEFGAWRFERVLLDFKPDIVFSIQDAWGLLYQGESPFRKYFSWVIMPTVDSAPQQQEWVDGFMKADAVLTYENWNGEYLKRHTNNKINFVGTASPGVDLNIFKPKDKAKIKEAIGLPADSYVFGSVMRNQKRKLYPDLFAAFAKYLNKCLENNRPDLYKKSFLYIHTSYPDSGWDIPELLVEYGIGHKTIFSYICKSCQMAFPTFFQDAVTTCNYCNNVSAILPSVGYGYTEPQMADMYNAFDCYIQYATCLTKNQEVLMKDGWKKIKDVKIGDCAWTHKGRWNKVINTFETPINEKLKRVKVWADYETLEITDNHPVLAYTKKQFNSIAKYNTRILLAWKIRNNTMKEPEFEEIKNLKPGDMIVNIINDNIINKNQIDISDFRKHNIIIDTNEVKLIKGDTYNRFINIDKEFCRFIGIFAADGCATNPGVVTITSNIKDEENIKIAKKTLNSFSAKNSKEKPYKDKDGLDVEFYSRIHQEMLNELFYNGKEKKLPKWSLYLDKELQKEIIFGIFQGDGYNKEKENRSVFVTTSKELCENVKFLLNRLRMYFSVHTKIPKNKKWKKEYRFEIAGDIKGCELSDSQKRTNTSSLYYKNMFLLKIKSIEDIDTEDEYVYNFEVEQDNSYTTRIGSVHNCEGFGCPMAEAAANGIPIFATNYSAMESVVEKTKGFPIKVQKMFKETINETGAYRAYPDNDYLAYKLYEYVNQPEEYKREKSKQARKAAEQYYDWDKTAAKWAEVFTTIPRKETSGKWGAPYVNFSPARSYDKSMSHSDFVRFLYEKVLCEPDKVNSYAALTLLRDLNYGTKRKGGEIVEIKRDEVFNMFLQKALNNLECERIRCGEIPLAEEDYISVARERVGW